MKAFDVTVEQEEPEWLSETIVIFANDIMDAMVTGLDLISLVREEVIKLGAKPADIANLGVSGISDCGVVMNQLPVSPVMDPEQVKLFAKVLHAQLD